MKAKITAGKMRFLMLCLTVLFSVMGISFNAAAAECTHPDLKDDNWEIIQKTTCQEQGYKTQWCYDCGTEVKEYLPFDADAHVKGEWTTITPHSCQQEGYQVIYCYYNCVHKEGENAGERIVLAERTVPAHDYEVIFKEKATCQKEGYEFVACVTCYDMKSVTFPVDPDVHDYTPEYIVEEATCNKAGIKEKKCLYCGAKTSFEYTDSENHTNIVWDKGNKVPATCDAPGYIPGKCEDCGKKMKEEIPQHSESSYIVLSETESTCSTNGVERRLCKCGLEYDAELSLAPDAHVYGEWHITKDPSCTDGSRYKFCKYHYEAQIVESIPSNGEHNYGEWVEVIKPDCSKTGLEKKTCTDCDESTPGHEITRTLPTEHDYGTWTTISDMSCNEKELIKGTKLAKCDNCNFEKYFTIPSVHSFSEWRIIVEADCEDIGKPGTMERICSGCKKVETKEYYAEHDFTDWYVTGKPVCAKEGTSGRTGTYTRWCKSCRKTEHKRIGVNHEFVDLVIDRYPECNGENGSTSAGSKTVKCKFCGLTDTVSIPAEHKFDEWVITKENNCNEPGEKVHSCLCCGYTVKEEIPAAHAYGDWLYNGKKVECGTEFKTAVALERCCTRENCNTWDSNKKMVTKIDHPNKVTVVTKESCTTSGYTSEICPDCGNETIVGAITPAKGHTLDLYWSSKNEATCNSEGSRYKACADCDYIEFQKVARTEHTLIELKPGLAPTCTLGGYSSESFCTVCRETFPSVELEPLGHNIPEGSEICSVCKAYKDTDCGCACHSTTGMERIFFNILNKLYQMFGINQECSCGVLHYDEPGFFAKLFGKA